MKAQPTKLARLDDRHLLIEWSDGMSRRYSVRELREACPCASCREKRSQPAPPSTQLPVISAQEARPLTIRGMKPIGTYAYTIDFSDNHDTGIYTYELLRQLGAELTAEGKE